ncbi:MAG: hypothetical protein IKA61_05180 [Clostridia bacterium]|nr:hypothetical protein [Clostridia bacterium]
MTETIVKSDAIAIEDGQINGEAEKHNVQNDGNISKGFNLDKTAVIFGQSEEDISKEFKEFKALKLFRRIDVDLTGIRDNLLLKQKIEESLKFGFGNVVVNPRQIKYAKRFLKGKRVGVYAAVCFPYGEELYGVKKYAVKKAMEEGADGVYLPLSTSDLKSGKIEQVKRELFKIVKRYKRKKIFAIVEISELNFASTEKIVKTLLKTKVSGIVSGTGHSLYLKPFASASDLHSLSGGKRTVVACTNTEKSREVVSLFSVADRVFLKNAPKIALELKAGLEF